MSHAGRQAEELSGSGHAVLDITVRGLDEATIGALLIELMVEAILTARLLAGDPATDAGCP
jgi:hypothetical protein